MTSYTTYVINLRNGAVTEYTGFTFTSITRHRDTYLATGFDSNGVEGVFTLGGIDDNGTPIDAEFLTGLNDFGTMKKKRIPQASLHLRGDGPLELITVEDEMTRRTFPIAPASHEGLHFRRLRLLRRKGATNWQVGVRNINGSDFQIGSINLEMEGSRRS